MRRIARNLRINRKTVVRKFRFLAAQAGLSQEKYLESLVEKQKVDVVYLDEFETYEITNCKPLSSAVLVTGDRKILGFEIAKFRPRSLNLRQISFTKYGYRPDERGQKIDILLKRFKSVLDPKVVFITDEKQDYPTAIRRNFPQARHETYKSRRAAVAGHGEMKEKGHDPLFAINHTFAMTRDNMNRLVRRTWATTKSIEGLRQHLTLYMNYHNRVLTV